MKSKHFKKRAFTVVELLVVLGIVGVLIVALMVGVSNKDVFQEPLTNVDNVVVDNDNQDSNILNLADHTHSYTRKLEAPEYLKTAATCTKEAVYYYSCSCGARASGKTFKGEKAEHDYSSFVIDDRYLASEATCLFGATYYYTCTMCGTTGEELFVYGVPDKDNHVGDTKVTYVRKDGSSHTKYVVCDACNESISTTVEAHRYNAQGTCTDCSQHTHTYNQMNTADTYLRTGGTCSTAPTYFHSCECGAMGTSYFTYGGPVPHAYGDTSTAYLKEVANCGSKAVYYKTCTFCGIKGADTFTSGEKDYTNHVGGTAMDYVKYDEDKHLANTVCATCRAIFDSKKEGHRLGTDRTCKDCSTHVHNFVFRRAEIGAMKEEATCYSPAVYWVTCACGEGGTETFTDGGPVGHDYARIEDDAYLIRPGSCTEKALYRMSCRFGCGDTLDTTFYANKVDEFNHYGNLIYGGTKDFHKLWDCCFRAASVDHEFVSTLEQAAACNYWGSTRYTCDCGYTFVDQNIPFDPNNHTGTVIAGNGDESAHRKYSCCNAPVNEDHTYNQEVVDDKYFASNATCAAPKQYYKSCECGYTNKSVTFGVGEKDAKNHVEERVNGGQKDVHKTCAGCGVTMENGNAHKYTITSPPTATCITQAMNLYVCDCGYSYESKELSLNPSKHVGDIVFVGTEDAHTQCTACERVVGDKAAHTFVESVDIAPTCTTMGTTKYTCECGYYYTEENIPALGHTPKDRPNWNNDHTVATVPCTRAGCEQTWSHTTIEQTLREPTCGTTRQYNHSVRIEVDGEWQTYSCGVAHEGMALGHEPAGVPVWNADHTVATVKCSRDGCNASWSGEATENVTSEATCINKYVYNHTATIVVNGVTKNFGCGTTHTEPELGHQFSEAATCTSAQTCLRPGCGMVLSNQLGHRLSDPEWNTAHTKVTVKCTRSGCGEKWVGTPVKSHYVVAGCTVAEEYTHKVTMVINGDEKIYKCNDYHYGSALGHSPGSPIWTGTDCKTAAVRCMRDGCTVVWAGESTERTIESATCTTTRKYEHVATFNVNGTSQTYKCTKDHSGSALGHLYTSDPTYLWNAGCLSCTAQVECSRSGCNYVLTETSDGAQDIKKKATCEATGQYNYYVTFAHIEFEKQICPDWHTEAAMGHAYTEETIADKYFCSAQTCDLPVLYYKNCAHGTCDAISSTTFGVGSALGHIFNKQDPTRGYMKSAATCTNKAVYYYRCGNSGCTVRGSNTYEYGEPLGHDFTEKKAVADYQASKATCTQPSYYYFKCSRCLEHNNTTYSSGKSLGHDFTVKDQSSTYFRAAADCNYGTRYWFKCSRCTAKSDKSDYQIGSKLGHDYSGPAATCSTPKICARSGCNVQLQQALGCDYSGPPATCISSQNCTRCNAVLVSRVGTHMNTYYTYSVLNCAYASLAPYHFKHTMCRDCGAEVEKVTENHYDNYIPPRGSRVCEACNRSWSTGVMN